MEVIKIEETEVILQDYGEGKGKIIIANPYNMNFSYYWSAMGGSLKEFLLGINDSYFANKLTYNTEVFSGKNTATNIRRFIREDLNYDLPWYEHMEFQKSLRGWIKSVETMETIDEFIDAALNISKNYDLDYSCMNYNEEQELKQLLSDTIGCEPWYLAGTESSKEYNFIVGIFNKLKKQLKK